MAAAKCEEYERLRAEVLATLTKISELTGAQLDAFKQNDVARLMHLDKQLENEMGTKERALGAARQHIEEHGCQREDTGSEWRPGP